MKKKYKVIMSLDVSESLAVRKEGTTITLLWQDPHDKYTGGTEELHPEHPFYAFFDQLFEEEEEEPHE